MTELPRTLEGYRNRHRGATLLVAGCGRSAAALTGRPPCPSIGVNDIGRLFDPDYLVVLNSRQQFRADRFAHIAATGARVVFSSLDVGLRHPCQVRIGLGQRGGTRIDQPGRLPYTRNSPYVALCLARLMGAARIGLIGVDFTPDHFFARTGAHPLAREFDRIDAEYRALAEAARVEGIEIVNLSNESRLTAFPREDLRQFLAALAHRRRRVVHLALTNCAGAVWNLHGLLAAHAGIESRVVTASPITNGRRFPQDILLGQRDRVAAAIEAADLLHFHNTLDRQSPQLATFRDLVARKPAVLQLHSEPAVLRSAFPGRPPETRRDLPVLVVAQKQARFCPTALPVPNALDITLPEYQPAGTERRPPPVVFTPSDIHDYPRDLATCRGKGYRATARILATLAAERAVTPMVRTGIALETVWALRRQAAIGIDECVTGGYHLTSLECLAQGLATFAWLDERTRALIGEVTGAQEAELPWISVPIGRLEGALRDLARDPARLAAQRRAGRDWMERYWHPQAVLGPYLAAYDRAIAERPANAPKAVSSRAASGESAPPGAGPSAGRPPAGRRAQVAAPQAAARRSAARPEDGWVIRTLAGRAKPRRSEDYPQEVRLSPELLARQGSLAGRVVHILGNGPSLAVADFPRLSGEPLIGTNSSPLLDARLGRATDYYCVTDRRFLTEPAPRQIAEAAQVPMRLFAGYCAGYLDAADINYVRICGGDGVSEDIRAGFYHNCSVVLFAAQLALWLGAREAVLHGCEFDYGAGRFDRADSARPHDPGIYPRISRNAAALARAFARRGGALTVAGPSRLTGNFGAAPVPGVRAMPLVAAAS